MIISKAFLRIKKIKKGDIKEVANLHLKCLPNTVSSKLGQFYLEKVYKIFCQYKNNSAFVALDKNRIVGAIGLTSDLNQFQRQIKRELTVNDYFLIAKSILTKRTPITDLVQRLLFERELVKNYKSPYKTIVTLFTDKNYRRHGVATQLLKFALIDDEEKNKTIYVDTLSENDAAIKLYKKFGFSPVVKIKDSILLSLPKLKKI